MSLRQLVVLGTSSQAPTRYRNHNGYLLLWDGDGFLFDPGEGTQRQMTLAGVSASQITRVALTHFHGDHCLGLPGVLQRISLDQVPHPVHVHYPASGQRYYEALRHASIYDDHATIVPCPHEAPGAVAVTPAWALSVAALHHTVPTFGYRLVEPDSWTVDPDAAREAGVVGQAVGALKRDGEVRLGDRVVRLDDVARRRAGRSFAFVMDTRPCPGAEALAAGVDLLLCESTFLDTEADEARRYGHMTADQAGRLAARAGARRLVLSHFSQRYGPDAPFAVEAGRHHPDVVVAADLLRVGLPDRR
jgi:ribonuclease Z